MLNYKKGQVWNKPLTKEMEQFERETKKNAVYRGEITGQFDFWLNWPRRGKKAEKLLKQSKKIKIDKDDESNIIFWMNSIIENSYERSLIAKQALQVQESIIDQDAQKAFNILLRMEGTNVRHYQPINFSLHALNRIIKKSGKMR